jgi:hypothetical protein
MSAFPRCAGRFPAGLRAAYPLFDAFRLADRPRRRHMAAMPSHDPIPGRFRSDPERAAAWGRFVRMMKWMALAAVVAAALALLYLTAQGGPMPLSMVIATIAGVGLSVLLGTALMGLIFLSSASGHDDEASGGGQQ